ncbi:helix-turn-helix domain-containing protein [Pararhodobacter marinus]|uniref:helix-turn-helix domain-containing protein n=1 Tax=Pararhodobacter marinus TaxID=2184063 RepID=UPI003512D6C8
MSLPARPMPLPPAQVQPFVEALGPDLAVTYQLSYGGSEVYVRTKPNECIPYVEVIGPDGAEALAHRAARGWMPRRVPLANAWLSAMLAWQGLPVSDIARKLRVTDVTVRKMLKEQRE